MDGEKAEFKKQKYNHFYMDVAKRVSQMSHAVRLKVGSVLVKNSNIISFGWNGMPAGWNNDCEDIIELHEDGGHVLKTKPEVLHSEANCLMKIAKSSISSEGADLFVTHAPCLDCAKLIYQSGISRVWYGSAYRDRAGVEFLKHSGVEVEQLDT